MARMAIGISALLWSQLGDMFLELPDIGDAMTREKPLGRLNRLKRLKTSTQQLLVQS